MEDGNVSGDGISAQPKRHGAKAASVDEGRQEGHGQPEAQTHKRSLSGGLFSKLSFLRLNQGSIDLPAEVPLESSSGENESHPQNTHPRAMAGAVQQAGKTRKRKGSLRKTALLGVGALKFENRERRGSFLGKSSSAATDVQLDTRLPSPQPSDIVSPISLDDDVTPRQSYDMPQRPPSLGLQLPIHRQHARVLSDESTSPINVSPTSTTTSDDEPISFPPKSQVSTKQPTKTVDSYFPPSATAPRHRSPTQLRPKSPLTHEISPVEEEWDYSETEWWGWIILVVTWIVFVVGMGSCLGVWSWAWDVGETPYAPPELEDDATLPIVGYYPALLVLTAVMAWVWVVVAWVGMKYFKHAKIGGEDL